MIQNEIDDTMLKTLTMLPNLFAITKKPLFEENLVNSCNKSA